MKFWEAPEIFVLSWPALGWYHRNPTQGSDEMMGSLTEWAGPEPCERPISWKTGPFEGDMLSEVAGRACYWSYGKGRKTNAEYLANIIGSGHGSVLEHPHWTFGLKGVSRSLSHELVRHRHLAFSQLSQRYVTEDPEFVVPPGLAPHLRDNFEAACAAASHEYTSLLAAHRDGKPGRAVARSVLPNATATRLVVTGNGRALRNMLALRGTAHTEAEFRRLAVAWARLMKVLAPNIFADFEIRTEECGEVVFTPNPKV
jgi:thymidylate synthase (FAD)